MKRKRITLKENRVNEILNQNVLRITKEGEEYFFEIGRESTTDLAEAVAIMMRKIEWNDSVWENEVDKKIILENITPEKALFWLTGGYSEWRTLNNYSKPWCESYLDFQEEFGFMVINIIKKAKKLSDIRDGFVKYLNLPTLYNFAISKNLVRR